MMESAIVEEVTGTKMEMEEKESSEWPKTMYMFYRHYSNPKAEWRVSLYKIELPFPGHSKDQQQVNVLLSPVAVIRSEDGDLFHTDMSCARLGSQFYFIGGRVQYKKGDQDALFPRDVFVLNLASLDDTVLSTPKKLDAQLNCGKPNPLVFAVAGKLYALGSSPLCDMQTHSGVDKMDYYNAADSMSGKMFECYDPAVGKWEVLKEPKVPFETEWIGSTFLKSHGYVIVLGKYGHNKLVRTLFVVSCGRWTPPVLFDGHFSADDFEFVERCGAHALYARSTYRNMPAKFSFQAKLEHSSSNIGSLSLIVDMVRDLKGRGALVKIENDEKGLLRQKFYCSGNPAFDISCRLHILGGGYLCHVRSNSCEVPEREYCACCGTTPDPCKRTVEVSVSEEIYGGAATPTDSFLINLLYTQQYVIKTDSYSQGKMVSSFIVNNDEMKMIMRRMDKKKNKKNKKKNVVISEQGNKDDRVAWGHD